MNKDIFERIKEKEHLLEERPSNLAWDKLQAKLDAADAMPLGETAPKGKRIMLKPRVVISGIAASLAMIFAVSALFNNTTTTDEQTASAKLMNLQDVEADNWFTASQIYRIQANYTFNEGERDKKIIARQVHIATDENQFADSEIYKEPSNDEVIASADIIEETTNNTANNKVTSSRSFNVKPAPSTQASKKIEKPSAKIAAPSPNTESRSFKMPAHEEVEEAQYGEVVAPAPNAESQKTKPRMKIDLGGTPASTPSKPSSKGDIKKERSGWNVKNNAKKQSVESGIVQDEIVEVSILENRQQFDWLEGVWASNTKNADTHFEKWEKVNEGTLVSKQYKKRGKRKKALAQTLTLEQKEGTWFLSVEENKKDWAFKLISATATTWKFEKNEAGKTYLVNLNRSTKGYDIEIVQADDINEKNACLTCPNLSKQMKSMN